MAKLASSLSPRTRPATFTPNSIGQSRPPMIGDPTGLSRGNMLAPIPGGGVVPPSRPITPVGNTAPALGLPIMPNGGVRRQFPQLGTMPGSLAMPKTQQLAPAAPAPPMLPSGLADSQPENWDRASFLDAQARRGVPYEQGLAAWETQRLSRLSRGVPGGMPVYNSPGATASDNRWEISATPNVSGPMTPDQAFARGQEIGLQAAEARRAEAMAMSPEQLRESYGGRGSSLTPQAGEGSMLARQMPLPHTLDVGVPQGMSQAMTAQREDREAQDAANTALADRMRTALPGPTQMASPGEPDAWQRYNEAGRDFRDGITDTLPGPWMGPSGGGAPRSTEQYHASNPAAAARFQAAMANREATADERQLNVMARRLGMNPANLAIRNTLAQGGVLTPDQRRYMDPQGFAAETAAQAQVDATRPPPQTMADMLAAGMDPDDIARAGAETLPPVNIGEAPRGAPGTPSSLPAGVVMDLNNAGSHGEARDILARNGISDRAAQDVIIGRLNIGTSWGEHLGLPGTLPAHGSSINWGLPRTPDGRWHIPFTAPAPVGAPESVRRRLGL